MKKIIVVVVVTFFAISVYSQDMGIGIRLGDPSGISFKKYFDKNAIEISLGRTHLSNGTGWYDNKFNDWYENNKYVYDDFQYLGYDSSTPIGIQVHYLFHKDLKEIDGLQWYYGIGGQFAHQTYSFDYRYKYLITDNWIYVTGEKITDFDFGVDGVIGLEYTFSDIPLSIFLDVVLFMEIADNPFAFRYQGGFGARYNF